MKRLLTAIAAAFVLVSPHLARAEDTKLTIMVFVGIQNLPLFAAQSQGLFAKHGLDVDMKIAPGSEVLTPGPSRRQMADRAHRVRQWRRYDRRRQG